ncbi:MAG: DUF805 domain-containing protein [Ruminococcus sp.]|nr:DUF805 domain-containing protein [Ruminococcus sp.]
MTSPSYVNMIDAVKLFIQNYTNFNGRSTRSEYWFTYLAFLIVGFVLGLLSSFLSIFKILTGLLSLAILIPSLALSIRRLHDIGKSGWYLLMSLIPLVGGIIVLVFLCTPSQPQGNQWGEPAGNSMLQ